MRNFQTNTDSQDQEYAVLSLSVGEGEAAESGGEPAWSFARANTQWRRTPPNVVVRRLRSAEGRSASDLNTCEHFLTLLATSVRDDCIREVRLGLHDNTYENALKVEVATDRLLDDLEGRPWRL